MQHHALDGAVLNVHGAPALPGRVWCTPPTRYPPDRYTYVGMAALDDNVDLTSLTRIPIPAARPQIEVAPEAVVAGFASPVGRGCAIPGGQWRPRR